MEVTSDTRMDVLKLMQQKDKIENDIRELTGILTKNGVGMNDPLVDIQGFPINTIDIYQVRHARHRIICLQNDHKNLMKKIEYGLQEYYSNSSDLCDTTMSVDSAINSKSNVILYKIPFAKVTLVSPGSPAEYCGIETGDLVVEFGSVNYTNFKDINDIAAVVQHSEGQQVNIKLQRGERYIVSYLIPKKWSGRGLLGCNIVSVNTNIT